MKPIFLFLFHIVFFCSCKGQYNVQKIEVDVPGEVQKLKIDEEYLSLNKPIENDVLNNHTNTPIPAASNISAYLSKLKNKRVGLVVNQTSMVGNTHLVDTLQKLKINIVKIFGPEHGFRGIADAGEHIDNGKDVKTGILVVSLYGNNKKPTAEQLKDIDILVFDIQDVGARFYTYISTLHYVMEACAESNKSLLILDRPNPNGHYVDGPVLKEGFESFVGMDKIPIVHGMTVGEYALMLNGEKWLKNGVQCAIEIIKVENYDHQKSYAPPIPPSPNLRDLSAIYLYPSLCLFEGTPISVGRGTDFPFKVFGHPLIKSTFLFIPSPKQGATLPLLNGQKCYGTSFLNESEADLKTMGFSLKYLIESYQAFPNKETFFNDFFNKLAGNSDLAKQIKEGKTEAEIRESWQNDLNQYKLIRAKYLLYP